MKSLQFFFLAGLILFTSIAIAQTPYYAANYNNNSYQGVSKTLMERAAVAKFYLEGMGYSIASADAANLKEGEYYHGTRTCYANNTYMVVAVTENGVQDLGLAVYDSRHNLVNTEAKPYNDGITVADFNQYRTANMQFFVTNYDSYSSYKNYQMIIMVAYK